MSDLSREDLLAERAENLRDVAEMKQMMEESEATTAQYEQMYEEALTLQAAAEDERETLKLQLQAESTKSGTSSATDVKRIAVLESHLARFKSEAKSQAQRLVVLEQTNDDLERRSRAAIGDQANMQDELAEAITENEVLQELMESRTGEHSDEIHRLRAQLDDASSAPARAPASAGLAVAQRELEGAQAELSEERDAVADLENQVSELSLDLDQSQETILEMSATRSAVEQELSAARAALAAAQSAASSPSPAPPCAAPHQRELEVGKLLAAREAEAEQLRAAHARDTAQMEELTAHVENMSADVLAKGERVRALEAAASASGAMGAAPRSDATAEQLRGEVFALRRKLAKKDAAAAAKEEKLTEEIEVLHRCGICFCFNSFLQLFEGLVPRVLCAY